MKKLKEIFHPPIQNSDRENKCCQTRPPTPSRFESASAPVIQATRAPLRQFTNINDSCFLGLFKHSIVNEWMHTKQNALGTSLARSYFVCICPFLFSRRFNTYLTWWFGQTCFTNVHVANKNGADWGVCSSGLVKVKFSPWWTSSPVFCKYVRRPTGVNVNLRGITYYFYHVSIKRPNVVNVCTVDK